MEFDGAAAAGSVGAGAEEMMFNGEMVASSDLERATNASEAMSMRTDSLAPSDIEAYN